jgi:hypothetical protein
MSPPSNAKSYGALLISLNKEAICCNLITNAFNDFSDWRSKLFANFCLAAGAVSAVK